jgi:hypothetical protein
MVRATEIRQAEKAAAKSTDQAGSSSVANAIEGGSLAPHQSDAGARHSRISEAAYRIAEARGFESGSELDDWLAAERDVDAKDQDRLMPSSESASTKTPSETSGSTTPGRPKETASRQQTRPDQSSATGSSELDEATKSPNASVAVAERPADAK